MAKETKTFSELSRELDELLEKMQADDIDIDEALTLHAEAVKLVDLLKKRLDQAEVKVSELHVN